MTIDNPPAAGGTWARRSTRVVDLFDPDVLRSRIRSFDEDPRLVLLGAAVGLVLAVLMAANLDRDLTWIADLVVALALAAPTAGISVIATLAMFREPAGLVPLGFNATVVGACALGIVVRLGLSGLAGRRIEIRPEFVAIGAYVGLTVFQFLWIATKFSHARELWARTELTEAASGLLLIVLICAIFTPRTRPYLLAVMIPGIGLAAAAAIISLSPSLIASLPIAGWLPIQDISARGTGFFRNPNYLGQAMAMALILVARGRAMALPGPLTRWSGVIAALVALAAIASFSRGALLGVAAGIVVLYLGRGRRVALIAAAIGAVVVLVGYQVLLATRHLLTFGPSFTAAADAQAASDAARITVYKAGIQMFLQHPVFGIGYGQFHYESVKYMPQQAVTFSHDVFLGIAAEQGLAGILTFLLLLAALAYALWRAGDQIALTAGSMLVAFAVGSLFAEDLTSLQTSCVLWVAIGCALALPRSGTPAPLTATSLRSPGHGPIRGSSPAASG